MTLTATDGSGFLRFRDVLVGDRQHRDRQLGTAPRPRRPDRRSPHCRTRPRTPSPGRRSRGRPADSPPVWRSTPRPGRSTGRPTTAGTSSVTVTATDGAGFSGSTSFAWTVTNTISVTNPGAQSDGSGAPIDPAGRRRLGLLAFRHPGLQCHRAARRSDHRRHERCHHGYAHHGVHLLGDRDGHGRVGRLRHRLVHLDDHQHGVGDEPRQPVRPVGHGHLRHSPIRPPTARRPPR